MKISLKITTLFILLFSCMAFLIVGVFALTETDFKVSGDIQYVVPPPDASEFPWLEFTYDRKPNLLLLLFQFKN